MFVVFEGPDNVGKTTLAVKLAEALRYQSGNIGLHSFPGKGSSRIGDLVYQIHHTEKFADIDPLCLQTLHIAAHIDLIQKVIKPQLLTERNTIILDRFWWSTEVYSLQLGIEMEYVEYLLNLEKAIWGEIKPDIIFLLERPINNCSEHAALCSMYKNIAEREASSTPIVTINNNSTIETCVEQITNEINKLEG